MTNIEFRLVEPTRVFKEIGNFLLLKLGARYLDVHFIYFYNLYVAHLRCILSFVYVFDISKTFLKKAYIHVIF